MELVAELITITDDFYRNATRETYNNYREGQNRPHEICDLLEMKLCGSVKNDELTNYARGYCAIYTLSNKPMTGESRDVAAMRKKTKKLRRLTKEMCARLMEMNEF